ncbi:MAG TPA: hydroxyisourate hydrolase, partial [Candidatus Limnocylindria bacterium]|nr:hydroxyisourate hydrolase [Candidatus Limnocylindria bacterium]
VLDLESGVPAAGMQVTLFRLSEAGEAEVVSEAETDEDGRIASLIEPLEAGDYQLLFDVASYRGDDAFFQAAAVAIHVADASRGCHVPLLLSPYGLSTYRGS